MSAASINTKINLRTDTKGNWEKANPVLGLGEIAIVCFENDYRDLKIGNGLSTFNQLSYLYQNEINAEKIVGKDLKVKSIAQGYNVTATPTSLATGIFSLADGNFDVVHGIEARAKEGDDYAFVFSGEDKPFDGQNFYQSHGKGSFNVNPISGLNGFYIGEETLSSVFHRYFLSGEISGYYTKDQVNTLCIDLGTGIMQLQTKTDQITQDIGEKVKAGTYSEGTYSLSSQDLSVVRISDYDYYDLVAREKQDNRVLYVLCSDNLNAHDTTIVNVARPTLSDEAATKGYVDDSLSGRLLSTDLSFRYASSQKKIFLEAFGGNIGTVDCADFIKDGMLSSVALCGNVLVFRFNTDAGTTPISVNLSTFVDNYDGKINALSAAISTIGEDYLDSNDKWQMYQDLLSPDEVKLYKGPGAKDISLSVGTGTQLCVYTATLSDFYLANETSSASQISSQICSLSSDLSQTKCSLSAFECLSNKVSCISQFSTDTQYPTAKVVWDISDYIDGLERAVYGEDKNRKFTEISTISFETVSCNSQLNDYLNGILEQIGSETRLSDDSNYVHLCSAVLEIYADQGEPAPVLSDVQTVFDAMNKIATDGGGQLPTLAASPCDRILFGGSAGTSKSMKQFVLELKKRLNDTYPKSETSSAYQIQNAFDHASNVTLRVWSN